MLAVTLAHSLFVAAAVATPVRTVPTPTGQVGVSTGTLSPPLTGEPLAAARRYAEGQRAQLGLPVTSTLGAAEAFSTRFGGAVHFPQVVGGLPVYGAKVIVTLDAQKRVYVLASSVVPYSRAVSAWSITPAQALQKAAERTPLALGAARGGTREMMFPVGDEVHAGYLAHVPSLDPLQNWFVAVDATNGEVLWARNRVYFDANSAKVYDRSPGGLDAGVGVAALTDVLLDKLLPAAERDGGFLSGEQLTAYNCCPSQDCKADAGSAHAKGSLLLPGVPFQIPYDVAICQRLQRASQDPANNDAGSFVYAPVDPAPPKQLLTDGTAVVDIQHPGNADPFGEVQAYYQVNRIYDHVKALSTAAQGPFGLDAGFAPFQMRDTKQGKKPAVWANITLPDFNQAIANASSTLKASTDRLVHVDNAAFVAKENFGQIPIPEYSLDVDTLMIFQGRAADFGYDATVLWHEFGHGVITATAAFESFTIDNRSGNNEGGAMHEGLADFLSTSFSQQPSVGEYVGPRTGSGEGTLRSVQNTDACPNVLQGEVHQDSQHFSGALWEARQTQFQGADQGRTFDAAVYAGLVSMTPTTDFGQAAEILSAQMPIAFPAVADAAKKLRDIFVARGLIGCSKIVDLTGVTAPRTFYGIGGTDSAALAANTVVPGPYQMRIAVPNGAKSVTVKTSVTASALPGSGTPNLRLLARSGTPITFSRSGNSLINDAQATATSNGATGQINLKAPLDVPCGGDLFLTLGNSAAAAANLPNVTVTVEEATSCAVVDAGTPPDAGYTVDRVPDGTGEVAPTGCGCSGATGAVSALTLLALWTLAARRRSRR